MNTFPRPPLRIFSNISSVGMRAEHTTSEPTWPAAGCEARGTTCATVLVDAETQRGYFGTIRTGVLMSSFLGGLITGGLIGVVVTLLVLMIVAGVKGPGDTAGGQVPNRKVFLAALMLLAVCAVCYTLDLEKSALLALLLSVLLIAKLGGSKRGIAAAGIAAVMLAWFLPPNGSLTVTGLDNRLALALFVLGTVVGSIVVEGNQWLKRWITTSDPDR